MAQSPIHRTAYAAMLRRLRMARFKAGLTQKQVADLLGRPQSFVAKSELGERRIDPTELAEFAKIYGRPITYFLESRM